MRIGGKQREQWDGAEIVVGRRRHRIRSPHPLTRRPIRRRGVICRRVAGCRLRRPSLPWFGGPRLGLVRRNPLRRRVEEPGHEPDEPAGAGLHGLAPVSLEQACRTRRVPDSGRHLLRASEEAYTPGTAWIRSRASARGAHRRRWPAAQGLETKYPAAQQREPSNPMRNQRSHMLLQSPHVPSDTTRNARPSYIRGPHALQLTGLHGFVRTFPSISVPDFVR